MFYELTLQVDKLNEKGEEKRVTERYITEDLLFAGTEAKGLHLYKGECDVTAIKRSKIMEFVNNRADDEQSIYYATIESIFIDENTGEEKATKYVVGLFAKSIDEANRIANQYMSQGLADLVLVGIKKTKIVDLL